MNLLNNLNEHLKRLRLLKYDFSTIVPGYLCKLYNSDQDDAQSSHHLLSYREEIDLFNYHILITKDIAKNISTFIAEAEKDRKAKKIKPKEVVYKYHIKDDENVLYVTMYCEGLDFANSSFKIPKITTTSTYYKTQTDIYKRIHNLSTDSRVFGEYSMDSTVFSLLQDEEDVVYVNLELDGNDVEVPFAISMYYGIRKPIAVELNLSTTNNPHIFMLNWRMSTDSFDENHISFLISR